MLMCVVRPREPSVPERDCDGKPNLTYPNHSTTSLKIKLWTALALANLNWELHSFSFCPQTILKRTISGGAIWSRVAGPETISGQLPKIFQPGSKLKFSVVHVDSCQVRSMFMILQTSFIKQFYVM